VLVAGAAVLGIVAGRMVKAAAPAAREEAARWSEERRCDPRAHR